MGMLNVKIFTEEGVLIMAVLNKDAESDIRSDIFQFINDRDKTKFFIDEIIDRLIKLKIFY